jgi:hypothetical protein
MNTIYLVQKANRYSGTPKLLRAYESRTDAEELVEILKVLETDGVEIAELQYEPTRSYSRDPAPQPPRFLGGSHPSLAELP